MDFYASDKEQFEQVKALWTQYGLPLVVGVVIASTLLFCWRWWQHYQTTLAEQASIVYETMLQKDADGDKLKMLSEQLKTQFAKTPYAAAGALKMAQFAVNKQDYATAITQLQWAEQHSKMPAVKQVATLRLARIYAGQKKYPEALTLLEKVIDVGFASLIEQTKGDIYLAQSNTEQAKQHYQQAWQALPQRVDDPVLKLKLENLGVDTHKLSRADASDLANLS